MVINLDGDNLFHSIDVVKVIWFVLEGDMFPLEVPMGIVLGFQSQPCYRNWALVSNVSLCPSVGFI